MYCIHEYTDLPSSTDTRVCMHTSYKYAYIYIYVCVYIHHRQRGVICIYHRQRGVPIHLNYVRACTYIHTYKHTYIRTYVHRCIHTYRQDIYIYIRVYIYRYVCICVCTGMYVCVCAIIDVGRSVRVYTYIESRPLIKMVPLVKNLLAQTQNFLNTYLKRGQYML